ncbi:broad-complex core protein isoforms 1/2/3/4/5 isoform X6 [Anastrepha obliqua]|uniref:broad-complex core protein isoforms 1/2/3/4/5 isoform X6 n=1 Tax=Anastrepha obliqua TaxID=95512 RepID=UPI00240A7FB2|nr:broad-complex core protein isoforms 1/2/3/4/5 isoform X6 [Anastrepha obliqua]
MDETQHFCLRWNNYQSSITSAFENLRDDEDFVDVTLACEGRSIKAHRVVLSACSPYFRDLLKSTPCKHPVILLQDVNFLDLHSLVEFIYHGEVNVHQKSLQSFLKTAEVLRVSGLTQQQAEETHSQLAQIQNLANAANATRPPHNTHHNALHEESVLYSRSSGSPPPPPPSQQLPLASTHINSQLFKRSMAMLRRERNNSTPSAEDSNNAMKRLRGPDNGLPSSSNNSPEIVHQRSSSPQLTPADFSTIKHNNNNTPPLKEEKRNGPSGNGNNGNANSDTGNGNGIANSDKVSGSLTSSPLTRTADDVKSEPMELVCSNNNPTVVDEHSNDSTGEHEANRSSSGDGGKGSLSSGNDEEIDNNMPPHPPPSYMMSPAESKLFPPGPFNFPMSGLDPAALAGFNSQLQSAAELSVSPQGAHSAIRSDATSPTSSTSSPPSPPTALTSPSPSSLSSLACNGGNGGLNVPGGGGGSLFNMHNSSPPRPGSGGSITPNGNGNCGGPTGASSLTTASPQIPLRMPPPTSGGINEPQECPYCRRTFSCYYSLKRHFQDKHEQSDTLYVCEFCHRRYRTKNSLTTHKSLQHRGSSGMLKRLLKTSAIKNVLVPPHHHHHHLTHPRASLFDFTSELGQPPPGIQ